MKVLLIDTWGLGGLSTFCVQLAKYLTETGVTVDAFCFMSAWPTAYLFKPYCNVMQSAPYSLTEMLVDGDYDIVHLSTDCFGYPLSAAQHVKRARFRGHIVATEHYPSLARGDVDLPVDIIDSLTAVSESTGNLLRQNRLPRDSTRDVTTVYNGLDIEKFSPDAETICTEHTVPILAWIGRADDVFAKDVDGFLYLASALKEKSVDFYIVDGSLKPTLVMSRLQDWFGPRLKYLHNMPHEELPAFYRRVAASGGALVSTSAAEAFGLTILEAWACGCPTIIPDVVGLAPSAVRYDASLIYKRQDGVSQVISLLPQLEDPTRRSQLIRNAHSAVEREFTTEHMGSRYLQIYKELLARPSLLSKRSGFDAVSRSFWTVTAKAKRLARAGAK